MNVPYYGGRIANGKTQHELHRRPSWITGKHGENLSDCSLVTTDFVKIMSQSLWLQKYKRFSAGV